MTIDAAPTLDGPRRAPLQGAADTLVVLVHGYGANGNDLIGLADPLAQVLPTAAFVAPDAPRDLPGGPPGGRMWFPITRIDPGEMERGCSEAGPLLDAFCDQELARQGLGPDRLVLVGFSQGAMLSMYVGPRRATAPAAIVSFSGALCGAEALKTEKRSAPPILLVHGDSDDVVPTMMIFEAAGGLADAGLGARWHISQRTPHGISPDGIALAGEFLGRQANV